MSNLGDIVFILSLLIIVIVVISITVVIFNFKRKINRRLEEIEEKVDSSLSK